MGTHAIPGPSSAVRRVLAQHARECAAWLLSTHRAKFRRLSVVFIHVDIDDEPQWLVLAADVLAAHPRWNVTQTVTDGGLCRVYRIERRRAARVERQ